MPPTADPSQQAWPWWPLLPLYPYGSRPTLLRELVAGKVWCFEQLHGVWYVAVPIRMTVLKVAGGLLLYAPLPPTAEVVAQLRRLEEEHGPVRSIVLATSSGLEHKVPTAPLARAFPAATVWVSDKQWSFPLSLPLGWLGFPAARTRVLFRDGVPHGDQLAWLPLGPINLGLGTFHEIACLDRATGSLLVTDALVAFTSTPPAVYELDPTPLLFHGREKGSEPLVDSPGQRLKGWKRILLFANFFRPDCLRLPSFGDLLTDAWAAQEASPRNHFGLYPFRWDPSWEQQADQLIPQGQGSIPCCLAPVLERLVFVRSRQPFLDWLACLAHHQEIQQLISAHYQAPVPLRPAQLSAYAAALAERDWAPSQGSWQVLAAIDQTLLRWRLVPP